MTGVGAAERIFQLIDSSPDAPTFASVSTQPIPTSLSRNGLVEGERGYMLEEMEGTIEFKDVHFSYPSRHVLAALHS